MKITKLRIDGQLFYLPVGSDIDTLKDQVLRGVSGPPSYITFSPVGYGEVTVLLTPHTPVRFEVEDHDQQQVDGWEEHPPEIDLYGFLPEPPM